MFTLNRNRVTTGPEFNPGNTLYMYRNDRYISPLYNGITDSMDRRFSQHQKYSGWFNQAETVWTLNGFDKRESLLRSERRLIRATWPIHNTQHNGRARKRSTESFFIQEHPELLVILVYLIAILIALIVGALIVYATYKTSRYLWRKLQALWRHYKKKGNTVTYITAQLIIDGILDEDTQFDTEEEFDTWLNEQIYVKQRPAGQPWEIYRIVHDHDDEGECDCVQYLLSHKPYWTNESKCPFHEGDSRDPLQCNCGKGTVE